MSNDVDFEQSIKLLDGALASDDENVKEALRKFLFVAAMVLGNDTKPGPFTKMMETMDDLQRRLHDLEHKDANTTTTVTDWTGWPAPGSPYWGGGSTGGPYITYTNGTGSINTGGTSTTTASTNAVSTVTVNGNSTTTGQITLNNTSGYSYTPITSSGGSTTTTVNFVPFPEESGTIIKQDIEDALDRLAKVG